MTKKPSRCSRARLGRDRLAAEPAAAQTLISACGGLPLALAIIAARAASTPELSLAAIADQLAATRTLADEGTDPVSALDPLETGDEATSIRSVFSWSCRPLTSATAR